MPTPEIAAIGLGEAEARRIHGDTVRVEVFPFAENDRAQAEGDTRGFGKLVTTRRGKVLGVTLVGRNAGDRIHVWSLALSAGLKTEQADRHDRALSDARRDFQAAGRAVVCSGALLADDPPSGRRC